MLDKQLLNDIAQKQSYVRQAFSDWLDEWKKQTSDIDVDTEFNFCEPYHTMDEHGGTDTYTLYLGDNSIHIETYIGAQKVGTRMLDESDCDIKLLRKIISNLSKTLQAWENELKDYKTELSNLINTVKC